MGERLTQPMKTGRLFEGEDRTSLFGLANRVIEVGSMPLPVFSTATNTLLHTQHCLGVLLGGLEVSLLVWAGDASLGVVTGDVEAWCFI
jgi:hypothetical protein